jgi:hypothetical protein
VFESRYHIPISVACFADAYKIYDSADVENLHSTDVVTFVGIASSEPYVMMNLPGDPKLLTCYFLSLSIEDDSSPEVPVLHVLCYQVDSAASPTLTNVDTNVRADLIDWISNEALGGDKDAAEWLLLQLASKVFVVRSIP